MLYIHIPYCKGKCIYCDFYSGGNPDWEKYLKAVASELSLRIDELRGDKLSSIYIGGGTPSLIPPIIFRRFTKDIFDLLHLNKISLDKELEFTIEVNPEDVEIAKIESWKESGVNRISMGIQSLNEPELKFLHRRHTADKAVESAILLNNYFKNTSVDIIYGIPGQTEYSLSSTIDKIMALNCTHISAYALTYEQKTPLWILRERGAVNECSEEDYLKFERILTRRLEEAGYERYEISNYALPGYRSRHNSGYWKGCKYLGLGPSAASFDGAFVRRTNFSDLRRYINFFIQPNLTLSSSKTKLKLYAEETLSPEERFEEKLMVSLRTKEGLHLTDLSDTEMRRTLKNSRRLVNSGYLTIQGDYLSLTRKGIAISDYIILELIK